MAWRKKMELTIDWNTVDYNDKTEELRVKAKQRNGREETLIFNSVSMGRIE